MGKKSLERATGMTEEQRIEFAIARKTGSILQCPYCQEWIPSFFAETVKEKMDKGEPYNCPKCGGLIAEGRNNAVLGM